MHWWNMWHIVLAFSFPHTTELATLPCPTLKCVHLVEAVARLDPQITGIQVFAPGDSTEMFGHFKPLVLNERKA